jgi:primosomal protein N' (replication factor Y)
MSHEQRSLFDTQPDPWELDDELAVPLARVVFSEGLSGAFDYRIPPSLMEKVIEGKRLRVPLGRGNQLRVGYCVGVQRVVPEVRRWKQVHSVVDDEPLLRPSMLRLTGWMAEHYLTDWGKVLQCVVPAGVRSGAGTRMQIVFDVAPQAAVQPTQRQLPAKQAAVLHVLRQAKQPLTLVELAHRAGCTAAPIRSLQKKGLIEAHQQRIETRRVTREVVDVHQPFQLHPMQQAAYDAIAAALDCQRHETFLLHGVTGSGKTEVYIKAIERLMGFGRQAIVLVPEISLTPQTQQRFRSRFPHVAVLHSHLSDAERNAHWQRIARGDVSVVVGARSAVFAPAPHLGIIVIDEEHDASFKQDLVPRYHARDVARQRAAAESIPLVLGSATPSLESWLMAQSGQARLLSMPRRILELPLPDVVIVDLRHEFQHRFHRGPISRCLHEAIGQALDHGEQIILLLNRRGFSTHIQCPACGHVVKCPACELSLTHHREGEKAICHYCDYAVSAPHSCPDCGYAGIRYGGLGTQRLEAEVRSQFPRATVLRMDSDTMRRPGSHEESLARFRRGEVQILLGTQMIAKGLDFPNVTVVGVISADTSLHLPDFRAAERTFQLVTQVAGRTGRGAKGGRVYVQTFNPEHPAIRAAERHDYLRFAMEELPVRLQFGYPPYGEMMRLIVRGASESQVASFADALARRLAPLRTSCPGFRLLGPASAPIEKLRGKFRYHMILQAPDLESVRVTLRAAQCDLQVGDELQWLIDVDPLDML